MSTLTNQIVAGIAIASPASVLGFLGYRRATHVDRVTEQAGIATERSAEINLVVAGLNQLVDNLQDDNASLRGVVESLQGGLKEATERLLRVESDCASLRTQLRRLQQKYGENGTNGGGATGGIALP